MDIVRGSIGPATKVRTLNLRLNFLMSFLPVLLYFNSSWSFKPRQCKEYSTFSGSGGPGFGFFMRVFSLDKFTGSKSIWCRLGQLFQHLILMNAFLQTKDNSGHILVTSPCLSVL